MKLTNGTWFECKESKGQWKDGEYLIEHESKAMTKYAIWHRGMIACGPFKTLKAAYASLQAEFNLIEKIRD